ncbi:MAG: hypothetical protein AAGF87_13240 [Bacteroidota bacterium]
MAHDDSPLDSLLDQSSPVTAEEVALWQSTGRIANLAGLGLITLVGLVVGLLVYLTAFKDHDFIGQFRYYQLADFLDLGLLIAVGVMLVLAGLNCMKLYRLTKELVTSDSGEQIEGLTHPLSRVFMYLGILVMLLLVKWLLSTILLNF